MSEEPRTTLGWRCWYDDDSVYDSRTTAWADLPDDGLLVKMIYYSDGTRQVQQNSFYFEAEHHSGEPIRGTFEFEADVRTRYRNPVIKKGRWAPDDYYRKVVTAAMASKWDD